MSGISRHNDEKLGRAFVRFETENRTGFPFLSLYFHVGGGETEGKD